MNAQVKKQETRAGHTYILDGVWPAAVAAAPARPERVEEKEDNADSNHRADSVNH